MFPFIFKKFTFKNWVLYPTILNQKKDNKLRKQYRKVKDIYENMENFKLKINLHYRTIQKFLKNYQLKKIKRK